MIYYLIIITAAAIDRVLKYFVNTNMSPGETKPLLGDFVDLTYVRNNGAAFSILQDHRILLIALPALLIAVGLVYVTRHRKDRSNFMLTSLSLVIAGGLGNLIDRVMTGYVIDFIDFRFWPVFNFADICVTVGCVLLCIYVVFLDKN
ncbi:MAG: signal peptidase II [Eubacteriaceae bacterium]|nr:signal peptidase II [Eubacteriaceae bacterium]